MSEPFDPYYCWLGIPPEHQPPHYYRLLGIEPFEPNPDVIEAADDRQMAHLRTYRTGMHAELSQDLLNEGAAAKVMLLDPAKKAAYDRAFANELKLRPEAESPPERSSTAQPPRRRNARLMCTLKLPLLTLLVVAGCNPIEQPALRVPDSEPAGAALTASFDTESQEVRAVADETPAAAEPSDAKIPDASTPGGTPSDQEKTAAGPNLPADPATEKPVLRPAKTGPNLLMPDAWGPWDKGFRREGGIIVCDNGNDTKVQRGTVQQVWLNQTRPEPICAEAWSKAEGVTGKPNYDYSLYLDIQHTDGTSLWQQFASFSVGTHGWERREVLVVPKKPIKFVSCTLLLRRHGGKAWFLGPELRVIKEFADATSVAGESPSAGGAEEAEGAPIPSTAGEPQDAGQGKPPTKVHTVAVLGFVDKGPSVELGVLCTALGEMLSDDLSQFEGIHVVERVRVDEFLRESNLRAGFIDGTSAERAGKTLAADYLLSGSFQGKENTAGIEMSLFEVGKEQPLAEWKRSVPADKLIELERDLTGEVLASLGIDEPVRRPAPMPKPGPSPTVAVLAFRNLSPSARLQPMEDGFADILQANLSAVEDVRLVERERIRAVLMEQELTVSGLVDAQTSIKVGHLLGAERLIYGSFVELGDHLRLDVRLTDTETASILRAETASGPTDDFASLIEDLTLRLVVDLAVKPPRNSAALVKTHTPTRKLEAAIHLANGERLFHLGQYAESAASFERVLLIEPENVYAGMRRVRAWYAQKDYHKLAEACEQALAGGRSAQTARFKEALYSRLITAYYGLGKPEAALRIYEQLLAEFPNSPALKYRRERYALALVYTDRAAKGVAFLEEWLKEAEAAANPELYHEALRTLFHFYSSQYLYIQRSPEYRSRRRDPEYMRDVAERTKRSARRAKEIADLILEEAEGKRGREWSFWARTTAMDAVDIRWVDGGYGRGLLDEEQSEAYIARILKVFSWVPALVLEGNLELAQVRERLGKWEPAIESYRYVLEHGDHARFELPPDWCDLVHYPPIGKLHRQILARFKIANISQQYLEDSEQAIRGYQQLVDDFGVTHYLGVNTVLGLNELHEDLSLPDRAALVWGGGAEANRAWTEVLEPMGFTVHSVGQYAISAGHLAPYSLVILVRTGMLPYVPGDLLALRSYVATGGSLLVVVSPGWEPAAPGIHNPLLAFFSAHAGQEMAVRADSTRIAPHPITEGIDKAMAKNAVHLEIPPETVLIQAGNRTVLGAIPYRHGRLVVASFAQWFQPRMKYLVWPVRSKATHWTRQVPTEDLPIETGEGLQLPLLRNVISWLTDPDRDPAGIAPMRKQFAEARMVSLKVQFHTAPRQALAAAMDELIVAAEPGIWKEEALWTAGEASLRLVYGRTGRGSNAKSGWPFGSRPPAPQPKHFQRLIDEFPDSRLRPLAQWRLAECERCKWIHRARSLRVPIPDRETAVSLYQQVEAPKGSYAWAWTQLRLGQLHFRAQDFVAAEKHFVEVADSMEHGPEKSMALLNVALCHIAGQRWNETQRYYRIALSEPDIYWNNLSLPPYSLWEPLNFVHDTQIGNTKKIVARELRNIEGILK